MQQYLGKINPSRVTQFYKYSSVIFQYSSYKQHSNEMLQIPTVLMYYTQCNVVVGCASKFTASKMKIYSIRNVNYRTSVLTAL